MAVTKVNYGHPPTLTIGEAVAEDAKIIFDGNAQDFHMGLDDTDDDLKIGLGSALGTTTHMAFTEDGAVLKPLQPSFNVTPASTQANIAIDTDVTVIWGTEVFDIGGNFATNTFTAPVTGKYQFNVMMWLSTLDNVAGYYRLILHTSNRVIDASIFDPRVWAQDSSYWDLTISMLTDMDASDTAWVTFFQSGGTAQTDIIASGRSRFSGYLVG
jgi:hypothetical protein